MEENKTESYDSANNNGSVGSCFKMSEVTECTNALVHAIKTSDAYLRFEKKKEELKQYPELRKKINEFREFNYKLQSTVSGIDLYDESDRFFTELQEFRKDPIVSEYLESELQICRILRAVGCQIYGTVDLELADILDEKAL